MDTKALRKGFGCAAGRSAQIDAYSRACNEAADEIDRLRAEAKAADEQAAKAIKKIERLQAQRDAWKDVAEMQHERLRVICGWPASGALDVWAVIVSSLNDEEQHDD